jgi:transcription antitermination factor NusG
MGSGGFAVSSPAWGTGRDRHGDARDAELARRHHQIAKTGEAEDLSEDREDKERLQRVADFLASPDGEQYRHVVVTSPGPLMPVVEDIYRIGPGRKWFVAYTDPRCEAKALQGCEAKGIAAYLPKSADWKKQTRREKHLNKPREQILRPALIRYFFVQLPVAHGGGIPFEVIRAIGGVRELVGTSQGPLWLSDGIVDLIREREAQGDFDLTKPAGKKRKSIVPKWLDVGGDVEITDGPFKGFIAQIEEILPNAALKVSAQLFGRTTPLRIDLANVKQV